MSPVSEGTHADFVAYWACDGCRGCLYHLLHSSSGSGRGRPPWFAGSIIQSKYNPTSPFLRRRNQIMCRSHIAVRRDSSLSRNVQCYHSPICKIAATATRGRTTQPQRSNAPSIQTISTLPFTISNLKAGISNAASIKLHQHLALHDVRSIQARK